MTKVEERNFDSALNFLGALRRSNPEWLPSDEWKSPWIFRGHSDAEWGLVPSAWRENIREHDRIFSTASMLGVALMRMIRA